MDELDNVLAELDTLTAELDSGYPSSTTNRHKSNAAPKRPPVTQSSTTTSSSHSAAGTAAASSSFQRLGLYTSQPNSASGSDQNADASHSHTGTIVRRAAPPANGVGLFAAKLNLSGASRNASVPLQYPQYAPKPPQKPTGFANSPPAPLVSPKPAISPKPLISPKPSIPTRPLSEPNRSKAALSHVTHGSTSTTSSSSTVAPQPPAGNHANPSTPQKPFVPPKKSNISQKQELLKRQLEQSGGGGRVLASPVGRHASGHSTRSGQSGGGDIGVVQKGQEARALRIDCEQQKQESTSPFKTEAEQICDSILAPAEPFFSSADNSSSGQQTHPSSPHSAQLPNNHPMHLSSQPSHPRSNGGSRQHSGSHTYQPQAHQSFQRNVHTNAGHMQATNASISKSEYREALHSTMSQQSSPHALSSSHSPTAQRSMTLAPSNRMPQVQSQLSQGTPSPLAHGHHVQSHSGTSLGKQYSATGQATNRNSLLIATTTTTSSSARSDSSVTNQETATTTLNLHGANGSQHTLQHQKSSNRSKSQKHERNPSGTQPPVPQNHVRRLCIVIGKKHHVELDIFRDETSRDVLDLISAMKKLEPKPTQVIYEELPKLQMLRIFEDHESIYEAAKVWLNGSKNTFRYAFKENKYRFLTCPEDYLIPKSALSATTSVQALRVQLINEYFPMTGGRGKPLEFSSVLYMKEQGRKRWVKKLVKINQEGIFVAKSDYKKALQEQRPNILRAAHISDCHLYYGYGWTKKLKAPTDFGFALKSPIIQTKNKNIAYFCCDSEEMFNRWVAIVRTIKYGSILRHNYSYVTSEDANQRIFQIQSGHERRLHPEKYPTNSHYQANWKDELVASGRLPQQQPPLQGLEVHTAPGYSAPMTQFYEQGRSKNVGAVNDFPPPPPFVHEMENVFHTAREDAMMQNMPMVQGSAGETTQLGSPDSSQEGAGNTNSYLLNSTLTKNAAQAMTQQALDDGFDSDEFEQRLQEGNTNNPYNTASPVSPTEFFDHHTILRKTATHLIPPQPEKSRNFSAHSTNSSNLSQNLAKQDSYVHSISNELSQKLKMGGSMRQPAHQYGDSATLRPTQSQRDTRQPPIGHFPPPPGGSASRQLAPAKPVVRNQFPPPPAFDPPPVPGKMPYGAHTLGPPSSPKPPPPPRRK